MKKIFNLQNLALVIAFLLPAYIVRFEIANIPLNALDALTGVFILLFFLFGAKKVNWKEIFVKYRFILILFLIILAGAFVSSAVDGSWMISLGLLKSWIILPFTFSFLMIQIFPSEKREMILKAYFFSCLAVALVALGYFLNGNMTYDGRLRAFFNSPNYLAMYLVPGIVIGGVEALTTRKKLKILNLAGLVMLGAVVYLTKSYASWVALLLSLGVVLAIGLKKKLQLALLAVVAIGLIFLQVSSGKFQGLVSFDERSSLSSRVMIWQASAKILEDNWLWGIGLGSFQEKYLAYQKYFLPYLEWAVPHPHNLFLAFWLYTGLVGLLALLGLLLAALKNFFKSQNKEARLASLIIVLYFLLHGLVDTTYFKNDLAVVFWVNLLLLI